VCVCVCVCVGGWVGVCVCVCALAGTGLYGRKEKSGTGFRKMKHQIINQCQIICIGTTKG